MPKSDEEAIKDFNGALLCATSRVPGGRADAACLLCAEYVNMTADVSLSEAILSRHQTDPSAVPHPRSFRISCFPLLASQELEKWLKTPESTGAGWTGDSSSGETVGHGSGRHIVDILRRNPSKAADKYTPEDVAHIHKVVSYCARHLAQEAGMRERKTREEMEKTKSTKSLRNWGHDPIKVMDEEEGKVGDEEDKKAEGDAETEQAEDGSDAEDKQDNAKSTRTASKGKKAAPKTQTKATPKKRKQDEKEEVAAKADENDGEEDNAAEEGAVEAEEENAEEDDEEEADGESGQAEEEEEEKADEPKPKKSK